MKHGFSLVELSIVLVILGLLTGGILGGQSLMKAAELRSITQDVNRYQIAINTFQDQYMGLPGDLEIATKYWGDDNSACADAAIADGSPGTCNGNGDGEINYPGAASVTGETFQLWHQLTLAGLLEGTYTGIAGSGAAIHHVVGTNSPKSTYSNGGWRAWTGNATGGGSTNSYEVSYINSFELGAPIENSSTSGPLLTPEEAWNVDQKMDDGIPGMGKVVARYWDDACATATSNTDYDAPYKLSDDSVQCALLFRQVF